ncbi:MAG: flagellin [Phaeospirillum sp.]|nr:flagellin [Phaeospirillum sp.]
MAEVVLSSAIRSNLLSLQATGSLVDRTNARLNTRLKVSEATDDAVAYFQNKSLKDRAGDLASRKNDIDQGISSLKTAVNGLSSVESLLGQMKGLILSAKSASASDRASLGTQLSSLGAQLNYLANDTSYQGLNLINATTANIKVQFSEKTAAVLQVDGVDVRISSALMMTANGAYGATLIADGHQLISIGGSQVTGTTSCTIPGVTIAGITFTTITVATTVYGGVTTGTTVGNINGVGFTMGVITAATTVYGGVTTGITTSGTTSGMVGFSDVGTNVSIFDGYIAMFDSGISSVRTSTKTIGASVALLQSRADFTKTYINTLQSGGDKLVNADLNEEGANLVSLQTSQQLGIQALSFANRSEQGILSLFR